MNRCTLYRVVFLWWLVAAAAPLFASVPHVSADTLMARLFSRRAEGLYNIGELFGNLYVKQRVKVERKNLALNAFPDMARFDSDAHDYVTELFYQLHYTGYGVLEMRRKAYNTSFGRGSGEIEMVTEFMKVNPYDENLLQGRIFSPLHPNYSKYYNYRVDSLSADGGRVKISFSGRFDNIRLLTGGWLWLDEAGNVSEFSMSGWDEQSRFEALYKMLVRGDAPAVVERVSVDVDYNFLGNKLKMTAVGCFDYKYVLPVNRAAAFKDDSDGYNFSASSSVVWDTTRVADAAVYATKNRHLPLASDEAALLFRDGDDARSANARQNWMWDLGEVMINSHSYDWEGGGVKFSPIIDPSSVDYSTGRGLSYKFSMNVRNSLRGNREFRLRPQVGYNFKQSAFYWRVRGNLLYNPSRMGVVGIDFGEGNRTYSSAVLDKIKSMALDSLKFENLNLNYFRNFYVEAFHESEVSNGLSLLTGVNFHRRTLHGNADKQLDDYGLPVRKRYVQFAPHLRLTWRPGMHYYIKEGRKVNLGSNYPVVVWDVEQGMNGVFGSNSKYARSELDVQYKMGVRGGNKLYLRFGAGGYFYTKDVYFVDYSFLKQNNLPLERSEELGGVFQLLDSEWYNAANKYIRGHLTYEAPFLSLQKLFPRIRLFQNEYVYYNLLFLSHLCPYMELGYGVATPYVDMGLFVSSQNAQMHRVGYKITLSLFAN